MTPLESSCQKLEAVAGKSPVELCPDHKPLKWQDAAGKERKRLYGIEWRRNNLDQKSLNDKLYREQNKVRLAAYFKQYAKTNPEVRLRANQSYRLNHKEKLRERYAQYNNSPQGKANAARYYKNHKSLCYSRCRAWFKANPSKAIEYSHARRARISGNQSPDASTAIAHIKAQKWVRCFYCGKKVSGKNAEPDHILPLANNGPHKAFNIAAACQSCNRHKSDKHPNDFVKYQTVMCFR